MKRQPQDVDEAASERARRGRADNVCQTCIKGFPKVSGKKRLTLPSRSFTGRHAAFPMRLARSRRVSKRFELSSQPSVAAASLHAELVSPGALLTPDDAELKPSASLASWQFSPLFFPFSTEQMETLDE